MSNVLLRVATVEDAKAIQAIYVPYVETTAITFEEVVPSVEEFEGRIQKTLENFPYLVLEEDGGSRRICICRTILSTCRLWLVDRSQYLY